MISKLPIAPPSQWISRSVERSRRPAVGLSVHLSLFWTVLAALTLLAGGGSSLKAQQQTPLQVVTAMVQHEKRARQHPTFFRYTSVERSTRTGGHLWMENVVETPDGLLRRLIAEDGKPLSSDRAAAEGRRIAALVEDPSALRAANADRRADEERLGKVLDALPRAFLFTADGMQGDCVRIAFRPNPAFSPSNYDERIVHGFAGTILIRMPAVRLCGIEGRLVERVSFGYGLLGHIDKDSHFRVVRVPVTATDWKNAHIDVHIDGKVLLFKSISREEDATHSGAAPLPPNLSLAQAAALTHSSGPAGSGQ